MGNRRFEWPLPPDKYTPGDWADLGPGDLQMCSFGLHLARGVLDVAWWQRHPYCVVYAAEVSASSDMLSNRNKVCARTVRLLYRVTWQDICVIEALRGERRIHQPSNEPPVSIVGFAK